MFSFAPGELNFTDRGAMLLCHLTVAVLMWRSACRLYYLDSTSVNIIDGLGSGRQYSCVAETAGGGRDTHRKRALGKGPRASVGDFKSVFSHSTLGELKQAAQLSQTVVFSSAKYESQTIPALPPHGMK